MLLAVREGGRWAVQACPLHGCSCVWKPSSEAEHNDSPQCGDSFPKFCSPLREAVNSHTQQRQLTWPASQPSGAACAWGWSHPISLLRGPVLFTMDPLVKAPALPRAFQSL